MMLFSGLFSARSGWLALCRNDASQCAVLMQWAGGKPKIDQVVICESENDDWHADTLAAWSKDMKAQQVAVTTLLTVSEYQLLPLEAPNVPHKEMLDSVRWQIRDQLSFSAENASLDILQMPRGVHDGTSRSVYAVAASCELIRKRMKLIEQAGFNLKAIDVPELAQRNLAALFEQQGHGLLMLSCHDNAFLLTITLAGELCMTRRISAGTAARQGDWSGVANEVDRSLQYFTRHFGKPVSRFIYAVIGQAKLHESLVAQLDVPLEILNLADVIDISNVPELLDTAVLAQALPAIGAALRRES